jgi:L-aspartate oxidase
MEAEMKKLSTWCLYLDLAHLPKESIQHEFPTIFERLQTIGLEIYKDWIPVVPAQHYSCGGVKTDLEGRTSIAGLFAAGEVACTGVHGANRLASNSLLEAIVFARSAAEAEVTPSRGNASPHAPTKTIPEEDSVRIRRSLQKTMTDKVGIVRTNAGLEEAHNAVSRLLEEYASMPKVAFSQHPAETLNLLQAAQCVILGAQARRESVGLHYNTDLPNASTQNMAEAAHNPAEKAKG